MLTLSSHHRLLDRIRAQSGQESAPVAPMLLSWGVIQAARLVPGASCLTQALVLRYLLARTGQPAAIRIGVAQAGGETFEAHAWVVQGDEVLIGGEREKLERYAPIVDL